MKILVCISKTPDTTAKIAFTDNNTKFAEAGVQWIINPYDEWYALVRAIELKEKDASTVIHLINVGAADAEPVIRKALALGGDEAIRINQNPIDSFTVASQITTIAKGGGYDLILTGKETIDYNGSSIGGMVAELLDLPYVSVAAKLDLAGNTATLIREIEGGEVDGRAGVEQRAEQHVARDAADAVHVQDSGHALCLAIRAAIVPAPKPSSMFTTATPAAQLVIIASRAETPPNVAP